MIELGIHFEGSPSTAETIATGQNNPIVRYAKDGASFSASSDFPTATKTTLTEEYRLLARAGITVRQMQLSVSHFYKLLLTISYVIIFQLKSSRISKQ
jgi:hypothetical protein